MISVSGVHLYRLVNSGLTVDQALEEMKQRNDRSKMWEWPRSIVLFDLQCATKYMEERGFK